MPLFDAYVFVDWSARATPSPATPGRDAVWVGSLLGSGAREERYHRTRAAGAAHVARILLAEVSAGRRVLVGFDFPYGYPHPLGALLAADGMAPWRAVWDLLGDRIADDDANANNRFEVAAALNERLGGGPGPFWGAPPSAVRPSLTATARGVVGFPYRVGHRALARTRLTEARMPGVQEAWKLMGAGSVGSQALLGIPRVRALRDDPVLGPHARVWPFETGFTATPTPAHGPFVLHAEIWPGVVDPGALAGLEAAGLVRDRAQVRLMCDWARDLDATGGLGRCFAVPGLEEAERVIARDHEGWILGCPPAEAPRGDGAAGR